MKTWQSAFVYLLSGVFLGMAFSAAVYLAARQPPGRPVDLLPAATPAPLMVQVAGEVRSPGVYALPRGSRVQDAIQTAGGFSDDAGQSGVNLAAPLKDGDKIVIPSAASPVAEPKQSAVSQEEPAAEPTAGPAAVVFPINLNTATLEELDALPGIGPGRASEIIRYREAHNGFKTVEELKDVSGIGDAIFERLKDKIMVEPGP
mgnify:CR=1 FL=1